MKKIIVFLSYGFMGYEKEIIKLLEENLNYKVFFINALDYEYKYKSFLEKIKNNFFYKPILKKTLKDYMFNKNIIKKIEEIGEIDSFFCIRADKFTHEVLSHIKSKEKPMYLHHWDSISFIKKQEEFLKYFDHLSTFDMEEAKKYDMKFIPNFYLEKNIVEKEKIEYEFFTVMKYDKRFEILEELGKRLKERGISYKFIVVTEKEIKSDYVDISKKYISLKENYKILSKSNGIVEIGHTKDIGELYQGGASFRLADAIGNKKKIITNYRFLKDYDVYKKENIFILEDDYDKYIDYFLNSNYEEYSDEIYKGYSGNEWIKKIFDVR